MTNAVSLEKKREHAMVNVHRRPRRAGSSRLTVLAVFAIAASVVGGCAGPRDTITTGSISDDYRQRHPIVLAEAEHSVDIPVATTDRGMTLGLRDTVGGFAQDYKAHATGTIEILSPQGSYNSAAVVSVRKQIRRQLVANGIPSPRIVDSFYSAGGPGDAAPIRLRFVATTAFTHNCGQWPEDLGGSANSFANKNWYNFGCASQNNLAAQVANPTDLVAPRAQTPIDAEQRANVIDSYRSSQTTLGGGGFGGAGGGF